MNRLLPFVLLLLAAGCSSSSNPKAKELSAATGETAPGAHLLAPESIRLGRSSRVFPGAVINAEEGPVWIGDNTRVLPHSYIEGPAYIGQRCLVHPGACILIERMTPTKAAAP